MSELLQASVSKWGQVQSLWKENDFLFSYKYLGKGGYSHK